MAETLTVALRVAEEAIEEAIAKAEEFSDSLVRIPLFLLFLSLRYLIPPCFSSIPTFLCQRLFVPFSRLSLRASYSGMQSWFLALARTLS